MKNNKTNEKNSNKTSREMMKQEAIKRMMFLKMHTNTIRDFDNEDIVSYSERIGYLYWANKYQEIIKSFEKKTGFLVYHLIYSETVYGRLLSVLFVSDNIENWEVENEFLHGLTPYIWCYNLDIPENSEYGTIYIKPNIGGLMRYY